jgi:hypothetical protein
MVMKKLFLMSLLGGICLAGSANAQLQKGTRYWGATITGNGDHNRYEYPQNADWKGNVLNVTPSVQAGWFIGDNKMFGLRLSPSLSLYRNKNDGPSGEYKSGGHTMAINLAPFLRHYKSLSPKWAIYLHSAVNLAYLRSKNFDDDDKRFENGYSGGIYLNPGVSFWVTPRFSLESDINVLSLNLNYTHFNDDNTFNFNTGITSSISQYFGIRASWYLQPK